MENSKNTEKVFDSCAKLYQEKSMELDLYHPYFNRFCHALKNKSSKVLDIGCGPGNISAYLLKVIPDLQIFGIDLSRKMLELARSNIPSAEFLQMDCRDLEQFNEKFDGVISGFCLPYLNKKESVELLNTIAKILNPEGVLYLSTMVADKYNSQWVGSSQGGRERLLTFYHQADYLKETLENMGFNILHEHDMKAQEREGFTFRDHIIIAEKPSLSY